MLSFRAMGVGISTVVPNSDAAGPIVSLVFPFNGVPGTSPWNDLLIIAIWGVVGVCVSLRRWDGWPKRG